MSGQTAALGLDSFVHFERRIALPRLEAERHLAMVRRPGLRLYVIRTQGIVVDTKVSALMGPTRSRRHPPVGQLTIPLHGRFIARRGGKELDAGPSHGLLDAVREYDERWEGNSFRALVIEWAHDHGSTVPACAELVISPVDLRRLQRLADSIDHREVTDSDIHGSIHLLRSLGLAVWPIDEVRTPVVPADAHRISAALGRLLSRLDASPDIADLVRETGIGERHLRRRLRELEPWLLTGYGRWKSLLLHTRLTMASCFATAASATTERIAAALGYREPPALLAAMRTAGLPSPSEIRRRAR